MKKNMLIIILVIITTIFIGCKEGSFRFSQNVENIESIDIVNADDCFEYSVEKTLSEEEMLDFLNQFQKIEFYGAVFGDPVTFHGRGIKITYENGDYEMVTHLSSERVENGKRQLSRRYCDEDEFNDLIEKFSDT